MLRLNAAAALPLPFVSRPNTPKTLRRPLSSSLPHRIPSSQSAQPMRVWGCMHQTNAPTPHHPTPPPQPNARRAPPKFRRVRGGPIPGSSTAAAAPAPIISTGVPVWCDDEIGGLSLSD